MTERAKCGAKLRNGGTCGRWPMQGQARCDMHGGKRPGNLKAAARRLAQAELEDLVSRSAPPIDVEPHVAILAMISAAAGRVAFWQRLVDDLDAGALQWGKTREKTGGQDVGDTYEAKPHVAYVQLVAESDRLVKYSEVALKAGVAERQVRIAERDGQRMVAILHGFIDRLGLTGDEHARTVMGEVVRDILAAEGEA